LQESATRLESLVESYPDCAPAWVLLGRLALSIPDISGALDFFAQALVHRPDDPEILGWLGDTQRRGGMIEAAQASLRRALMLAPQDLILTCKLANSYVISGELFEAKALLTQALDLFPAVSEIYLLRGLTCRQMRNDQEAESDLRLCLGLAPDTAPALAVLGDICLEQQKPDEAVSYIEKAIQLAPDDVAVLRVQGNLSVSRKDWKEAAYFYQKVLVASPDDVVVALNHAAARVEMGDALGAIDALEACIAVGATEQWVYEMTGLIFAHRGQWQVAVDSLEKAVEKEPQNVNAWNTLIVAYNKLGLMEKAEFAAKKALEINPNHISALINLAGWYIDLGRHDEGVATFQHALDVDEANALAYTGLMFGMLFSSRPTAQDVLEMGRRFDRHVSRMLHKRYVFMSRNRAPGRVLRIGWVSSDLRAHPVGAFIAPFFPYLDLCKVETYVYDNWPTEDSVTATIKPSAKVWRSVRGLGDGALAECIRADEIDILIDLNGHTAGHRLGVFARKPAPIQVEWLGFPGTSGLSAIDYVLVPNDDYLLQADWCAEKPWALPNCYGVRGNIPDVAVREGLPSEENGYFTFACMNRYSKVSTAALDLWAEILQKTGNSRLLLIGRGGSDEQTLLDLRGRFASKGISADRLMILNSLPTLEYFDTYNRADVCLDPFPFNGGTTGFDSIWMGVPFVTLRGDALHSRAGSNILKYVGLNDLIAETEVEYVEKAVALVHDLSALRRHRAGLRQRMQDSPLLDCAGFARGLEDAFRKMWEQWCSNEDSVK
jgi:predicted O-linked N-acetylglucosamine transferase (SPINDLY family)